ncbi:MAG: methyltransferase regulatory domain-containing protein [Planctomycetes bacterium]|nr:methyltransferase regulatory domain-containing protein [Planctomycetota bacterium]
MAVSLPEAKFYGIDLSKRQLEDGWQQIEQLQLSNIELAHRSILDLADDEGPFDYIVCHGVYSWVARDVQDKIFDICEKNQTDNGVAYVSYNTYPGWFLRGMVRRMMCFHARQFDDAETQVQQARALLDFLINAGVVGDETYHTLLLRELEIIRGRQNSYLFHEHLEEVNEPEFFYEFIERAEGRNLRYLSEVQFSEMVPANYGSHIDTTLRDLGAGLIHTEQYLDFLKNRTFRRTLLCHKEVELNRQLGSEQLRPLSVSSRLRAIEPNADLAAHGDLSFQTDDGPMVTVAKPLLKAALAGLARIWPKPVQFESIPAFANRELGRTMVRDAKGLAEDFDSLGSLFLELFAKDLVTFRAEPLRYTTEVSLRPVASRLARRQAEEGEYATNLFNGTSRLDDLGRRLIRLLDGSNDASALRLAIRESIAAGDLIIEDYGQDSGNGVSDEFLDELLQQKLEELARSALLLS